METGLWFRLMFVGIGFVIFGFLMNLIFTKQFEFNDLGWVMFNFLFWYYPVKKVFKD